MNRVLCASRRHVSDVFHGDPFKIQSYNFRYAEKPVYHVQHYQRPPVVTPPPAPPPARKPSFETFYLNPKFNRDSEYTPVNRPPPTSSFSEHRRRRFLQDFKAVPSYTMRSPLIPMPERQRSVPVAPQPRRPPVSPTVTDSPLLRTCCSRGEYQTMRRGQSTSSLRTCTSNGGASLAGNARSASATTFACGSNGQLQTKRSTCSGCAININICGLDPESEADNNVSIKIETDACLLNNKDRVRSGSSSGKNRSGSSGSREAGTSFGIDKRLSKFNVSETKPRTSPDWERRQRQREVQLKREQVLAQERQHQEDLKKERERELQQEREFMRRREQEREHLRQLERQREREHLIALEKERERQRLRELERETQRQREYNRLVEIQEQLCRQRVLPPTRAAAVPPPSPVPMTSHLYTPASDDRLPGMMPFCDVPSRRDTRTVTPVRHQAVAIPLPPPPVLTSTPIRSSSRSSVGRRAVISSRSDTPIRNSNRTPTPIRSVPPTRSSTPIPNSTSRNPVLSRNPTPTRNPPQIGSSSRQPTPTRDVPRNATPLRSSNRSLTPLRTGTSDRSSSRNSGRLQCTSSGTSNGNVHVSVAATRIVSNSRLSESKQINGSPAIVTRLNNVPIRITTSRPRDRDVEFSMNQVTVREPVAAMPAPRTVFRRRSDSSQSGHDACQVNINVYADNLRRMRI